jgi:hypothetical protein
MLKVWTIVLFADCSQLLKSNFERHFNLSKLAKITWLPIFLWGFVRSNITMGTLRTVYAALIGGGTRYVITGIDGWTAR